MNRQWDIPFKITLKFNNEEHHLEGRIHAPHEFTKYEIELRKLVREKIAKEKRLGAMI